MSDRIAGTSLLCTPQPFRFFFPISIRGPEINSFDSLAEAILKSWRSEIAPAFLTHLPFCCLNCSLTVPQAILIAQASLSVRSLQVPSYALLKEPKKSFCASSGRSFLIFGGRSVMFFQGITL